MRRFPMFFRKLKKSFIIEPMQKMFCGRKGEWNVDGKKDDMFCNR